MKFPKLAATFALASILLATAFSVCRQMSMVDLNSILAPGMAAADCVNEAATCPAVFDSHMDLFSRIHPSTAQGYSALLFLSGLVVFFAAWFLPAVENTGGDLETLQVRIRTLLSYLTRTFTPLFLVFAFSRGILHSKRHA